MSESAVDLVREMYTYEEFAALLHVTKDTIYRWVRLGMIPSPTYLPSARFSAAVVSQVQREGTSRPGSYIRTVSERSIVGKEGAEVRAAKRKKTTHKYNNAKHVKARAAYAAKKKGAKK